MAAAKRARIWASILSRASWRGAGGLGEIPACLRLTTAIAADRRGAGTLVSRTGGFQDDQLVYGALSLEESLHQRGDALGIVVDGEGLALGQEVNIQTLLGTSIPAWAAGSSSWVGLDMGLLLLLFLLRLFSW